MTIQSFQSKKEKGQKISMVTCYDYWTAQIIKDTSIDSVLVGDSAAMIVHGHNTTLPIDTETMSLHVSAVSKGLEGKKFLIADMPFMSYQKDHCTNMTNIEKLMKAGAMAIKIEGAIGHERLIESATLAGVPVMGHLGLTPQSVNSLGGFKVQGKEKLEGQKILEQAKKLQDAGCFSLVLECIPGELGKTISDELDIPTIGIGAGPSCSGQVLVLQDLLGMNQKFKPKFLRTYLNGFELFKKALDEYHHDVIDSKFPNEEESYK